MAHSSHADESRREAARMEEKMFVPRFGGLRETKPPGVLRFMYIQANGLAEPLRRRHKLEKMMQLAREFEVDGVAICEVGVNWKSHGHRHRLGDWVNKMSNREVRASLSFNVEGPRISLGQQGGTAIVLLHGLLQYAHKATNDFLRSLGRWASWTLAINPIHRTRLVVAYCPG